MPSTQPSPTTIVLIDPDDIGREGVAKWITDDKRFALLRAARNVAEAQLDRLRPALVCCDPRGRASLDHAVIEAISVVVPNACICIYTTETEPSFVLEVGQKHLGLYLLKGSVGATDLLTMLDLAVRTGVVIIDPDIAARFRDRRQSRLVLQQIGPEAEKLSQRESQVLQLYGSELRVDEIARRLTIDHRTVSTHLRNARDKLGAGTNAELIRLATEQGLLGPQIME